jgi:hypothetical protein
MDENQERIKKMYLRINSEPNDHEMSPPPPKDREMLLPPPKKGKTKTFTLDEDQVKKLEEWQSHIKAIYGSYGNYEYTFSSNGLGQIVTVHSELADIELDLTDVDSW